jgi:hypothetical protein
LNNAHEREGVVIFTDSLNSLFLISDLKPKRYINLVFNIQDKLISLSSAHEIRLQFVPGHRGIAGNEAADQSAKEAHHLQYRTLTPPSKEEIVGIVCSTLNKCWEDWWKDKIRDTGRGKFLAQIKDKVDYWPWTSNKTRLVETVLARLRVGHAGVRHHLARFNLAEDPNCECGSIETVEHLLLTCPNQIIHRTHRNNILASLNVPVTLKNLLGGGPFPGQVQNIIANTVAKYLADCNKIGII